MRGKYQRRRERRSITDVEQRLTAVGLETVLPKRTYNALQAEEIVTLLDVAKRSEAELLQVKSIGQSALTQIRELADTNSDVQKYRSVMGLSK